MGDADVGLANGDPRAAEQAFQLLQQVTGRAGRGEAPGRELFKPDHPVMLGPADGRRRSRPAGRRSRTGSGPACPPSAGSPFVVSGTDRAAAETHARALAPPPYGVTGGNPLALAPGDAPRIEVFGPARAPSR